MPENTRQSELLHRLDKVPRAAWKRFATHFKHLVHRPEVSATKSPVQNIRAVCDSISTARPTAQPTKRRTKKTPGTRRRRRWIIPKWVIDGALLALFVAGVAKLDKLFSSSTERDFFIMAKINDSTLNSHVRNFVHPQFHKKIYSLHITLVKGKCDVSDREYIYNTVLQDVKQAVEDVKQKVPELTFTLNTENGIKCHNHTLYVKTDVQPDESQRLYEELKVKRDNWKDVHNIKIVPRRNYHVTLGTISTEGKSDLTILNSIQTQLKNIIMNHVQQPQQKNSLTKPIQYTLDNITIEASLSYPGYK